VAVQVFESILVVETVRRLIVVSLKKDPGKARRESRLRIEIA